MRSVTGTGLVIGALAATLIALLVPVWSFPGSNAAASSQTLDGLGTVSTQYGPLTEQDRDFVRKVRLAGLWEGPSGQMAVQRGGSAAVKTAGEHLIEGHKELDERVLKVGAALGMELPTQPNDQQQGWLNTMSADLNAGQGAAFDRDFANLVRAAHGKVFAVVAQIRANTRNSMVRSLADRANTIVLDHITVLEKTGLVDFEALARDAATSSPTPPTQPVPPPATPQRSTVTLPPAGSLPSVDSTAYSRTN